jgi:hypothetical protein
MEPVYVAPGGIYAPAARVYVNPAPEYGPPAYVPGPAYGSPAYVAPRPAYAVPGPDYAAPPVYAPAPAYGVRERAYVARRLYAEEWAPRPLAGVPYNGRCVVALGYGRWEYCD